MELIPPFLPESPPLFPPEMKTDRSDEFHIAEIIREKLTLMLHQEMPYGLTVQIERLIREEKGIAINAVIWVERDSQKGIAVGKNGSVLKKVGRSARLEIASLLGEAIHLELWVKVKSNWADSEKDLMSLGYEGN
jgi:GTP-binding protein Era